MGLLAAHSIFLGSTTRRKDKTFFFWSEELRLEETPVDYNQAVPTMAERSGDFSDVCPVSVPGSSTNSNLDITQYPDCPRVPGCQCRCRFRI